MKDRDFNTARFNMDAMAYMFSVARANSSNVLEFNPECIMQEDLMSLSSKFPLIPGSQRSITFCTTCLSQKVRYLWGKIQMSSEFLASFVFISESAVMKHVAQGWWPFAVVFQTALWKGNWRLGPKVRLITLSHKRPKMPREEVFLVQNFWKKKWTLFSWSEFHFDSWLAYWFDRRQSSHSNLNCPASRKQHGRRRKYIVTNVNFCSSSCSLLMELSCLKQLEASSFTDQHRCVGMRDAGWG